MQRDHLRLLRRQCGHRIVHRITRTVGLYLADGRWRGWLGSARALEHAAPERSLPLAAPNPVHAFSREDPKEPAAERIDVIQSPEPLDGGDPRLLNNVGSSVRVFDQAARMPTCRQQGRCRTTRSRLLRKGAVAPGRCALDNEACRNPCKPLVASHLHPIVAFRWLGKADFLKKRQRRYLTVFRQGVH